MWFDKNWFWIVVVLTPIYSAVVTSLFWILRERWQERKEQRTRERESINEKKRNWSDYKSERLHPLLTEVRIFKNCYLRYFSAIMWTRGVESHGEEARKEAAENLSESFAAFEESFLSLKDKLTKFKDSAKIGLLPEVGELSLKHCLEKMQSKIMGADVNRYRFIPTSQGKIWGDYYDTIFISPDEIDELESKLNEVCNLTLPFNWSGKVVEK